MRLEAPSWGSCRDGRPHGAAACGQVDAEPRNAAAVAAAAVVVNVAAADVSVDVNAAAEAASAVVADVPSLGLCERQVYCW